LEDLCPGRGGQRKPRQALSALGPPYEAYGTGIFLVRPDGYVGWAGATAAGLPEYAARFGALAEPRGIASVI
jgi:hypothetical protein